MLIDDENIRVQYDSTAESPIMAGDPLPLPFKFVEKTQVHAILSDGTELILNQDYTVGYPEEDEPDEDESIVMTDNMVVILNIDIPVGETVTIYRETALDQTSEFPQEARFSSRKIEDALDKLTMQNQEQRESLARALKLPLNAPIDIGNLALPNPEPNRSVKWNGQGTALVNTEFDPDTALITTENYKNQALTAATGAAKSEAEAIKQATDAKNAAKLVNDNIQSALDKSDSLLNMSRVLPMFTPIWSDHTLNDASFLRADTFSWHSGKIYEAAYQTLLAEFTSPDCVHESENGVTYRRTPSGFKIADPTKHDAVLNAFTSTGKSWFYVIDPDNKRFKLPRTKYSFTGIRDTVGGDVQAGLPTLTVSSNGAHTHTANSAGGHKHDIGFDNYGGNRYGATTLTGSYKQSGWGNAGSNAASAYTSTTGAHTHTTTSNGAHTHTIPGTADTVQPPATQMYLYFFVGNYVRPNTDINIGKLVEYINEIDFVGDTEDAKAELNATKNNCIKEINSTSVGGRVLKTGDTMTGNLYINRDTGVVSIKGTGWKGLTCTSTDIDYTSTDHINQYCARMMSLDKNGKVLGYTQHGVDGRGNAYAVNSVRRNIDGTEKTASVGVYITPAGVMFATAPTPATGDNSTKIATTAYCVNMRCTTKATTTSSASTTRPCWVVQNYVSGKSWYRVWSDGWIEQGGGFTTSSSWTMTTITFLKAFSNTNYMVTSICGYNVNTDSPCINAKTNKNFSTYIYNSTGNGSWYACGY